MSRSILVTEGDSPLGAVLVRLLVGRGYAVAATSERVHAADGAGSEPSVARSSTGSSVDHPTRNLLMVAWNRRSPASAHAVFLTIMNSFGSLDEAIVLDPPAGPSGPLADVPSAAIERAMDEAKGPLFLAREITASFAARGSGVVAFVCGGPAAGPVDSAVRESFHGMAGALLAAPSVPGIIMNGFQGGSAQDPEEYAAFIDRTLEEKARKISGRWFSSPPRGGFLQGVFRTSTTP